jgi:hypothetical protein
MDSLFGVLSKPYCNYFYLLAVIGYVWLIISVLMSLYFLYKSFSSNTLSKEFSKHFYVSLIPIAAYFILYFQNRSLYSMCMNSLK